MNKKQPSIWAAVGTVIVGAGLAALGFALVDGRGNRATWRTYTNSQFGYSISYPSHWSLEIRDPQPGDDFEGQSARLTNKESAVLAAVNFQGGWCESGPHTEEHIEVSGIAGVEYECYFLGQSKPNAIVRVFWGAKGRMNYAVLGNVDTERTTIRRIIESFRFIN